MKYKLFKLLFPKIHALYIEMHCELKEFAEDLGGCDHSVGLCQCDLDTLLEAVEETL